ncbi:ATP-dependent RNA helicase [Actinobaculum suis]|uniref:ATP-dependent RNA helicase n=1 Tax=Actinobaculum suis TaxID=1657 RepID=A0A7Z9C7U4_9ACTO|nr:DEAD/DEAH box helicase [Actinobaculum suis]VDG75638.1 ATP-dependent RNA helicase [Actinobaculum suis]
MDFLLDTIRRSAQAGQIAGEVQIPARPASYGQWPSWVPPELLAALEEAGAGKPWTHQATAADLIYRGINTVVATGTGSGKSLAAWVPLLAKILPAHESPSRLSAVRHRPTGIYLAPTKALAADQYDSLHHLLLAANPQVTAAVCDGDTDRDGRRFAREYADIVLSNPDFMHRSILANHPRWTRVLRGLQVLVIDEFHYYRGVFGANIAHVVRRLLRLARHYGARPTVVALSATVGDPQGTARRFLGDAFGDVAVVTADASPSGARNIVFWRCQEVAVHPETPQTTETPAQTTETTSPTETTALTETTVPTAPTETTTSTETTTPKIRRSAYTEAGELMARLVAAGGRILTFVRSRPGTERVAQIAREYLERIAAHLRDSVAAYRGGYLPEERRLLEQELREGTLRGLSTTSALELGIDISGLDGVIVCGWPGTRASFLQQVGRAGRAGQSGVGIFIGRENPLDQYLLSHPEQITTGQAEVNVFDPANPNVLVPHVCAAAAELPLTSADANIFGVSGPEFFTRLEAEGFLKKRPTGWFWNTSLGVCAHDVVDLRGSGTTVSIIEQSTGALLGTVDSNRADTTVFPGAIYIHQGAAFHVESLTAEVAFVSRQEEADLRTFARQESRVEILDTQNSISTPTGVWARGEVLVESQVTGYDLRRARDGMYLGFVPLTMPVRQLRTQATWWTITPAALAASGILAAEVPGGLHGAEHAAIAMLPFFATCDRWDLGGLSTALHADTGCATVIVHDAIPGGSGCAERGYDAGARWIAATLDLVDSCPCDSGCPRCIQSPKCGNNNEPLHKKAAIAFLRLLLDALQEA